MFFQVPLRDEAVAGAMLKGHSFPGILCPDQCTACMQGRRWAFHPRIAVRTRRSTRDGGASFQRALTNRSSPATCYAGLPKGNALQKGVGYLVLGCGPGCLPIQRSSRRIKGPSWMRGKWRYSLD
ncbi:hypothetical protein MCOR33_005389 [Pyricularia grisea]|uniref:Uncharacterized protein n=1 Tax=Pyricularia grisea TaxID=148305 RepID=A0ABQ8NKJ4_PYRGI|nr:hypothetical protein MCOR33_005389 [Pyricularia grisea]